MDRAISGIVAVLTAIVGVAALAVIFSPQARTAQVVQSSGEAFSNAIRAAGGPVLGGYGSVGLGTP